MEAVSNGDLYFQKVAPSLEFTAEGWWASRAVAEVSYPDDGNEICFLVEDTSFWFQHRNRCIVEMLRQFPPGGAFFDVGGGNGCVARAIQEAGHEVILVEPGPVGARNALSRGIRRVVRSTLEDAGIDANSLPAVGLFDVVEHIADDKSFLAQIHRLTVPGGKVYITVPAYQWLWSAEDEQAGHFRRYRLDALKRLVESVGYQVDFASYFFGFLPLPILLRRVMPYRLGFRPEMGEDAARADHRSEGGLGARILQRFADRELSGLKTGQAIRSGGSCLVVARKSAAE